SMRVDRLRKSKMGSGPPSWGVVVPCCTKSENENSTTPRVFTSYRFFSRCYNHSHGSLGHPTQGVAIPRATRPLSPDASSSQRTQQHAAAAIGAKLVREKRSN